MQQEPDGSIILMFCSNNWDTELIAKHPSEKGIVRADMPMGGWYIQQDQNDPNKSHLTFTSEIDFKGLVPEWVLKSAFNQQGYCI